MEAKDFISSTVVKLNDNWLDSLKSALVGEYLEFEFIDEKNIDKSVFAEKIHDYFEKLELKTSYKFNKTLEKYLSDWDDIVKRRIVKEPAVKKGAPVPPMPRARKYYNFAMKLKSSRNISLKHVIDYSRIMMCLYMSIINEQFQEVDDFDYSARCLDLDQIISGMKNKKADGINLFEKKNAFDLEDLYCSDTSTFIITIIMFYCIKNNEIPEE